VRAVEIAQIETPTEVQQAPSAAPSEQQAPGVAALTSLPETGGPLLLIWIGALLMIPGILVTFIMRRFLS